jgi:alpha-tubulin suppressor-like RCC1 family protein/sugar lactone lactonase YvrE
MRSLTLLSSLTAILAGCHSLIAAVENVNFTSPTTVGVTSANYSASGNTVNLTLAYAPVTGESLRIVNQTGLSFISGSFDNLTHGQAVSLSHNSKTYQFVANYYGGDGNDLVLHWAETQITSWGYNPHGQLGNGTFSNTATASSVAITEALNGKTVLSVAISDNHGLALCSDGSIAAWGENSFGQLGDGTTLSSTSPVAVVKTGALAGKTVIAIAAGFSHSLALCSDGSLVTWGNNYFGQLGNSSNTSSVVPLTVTNTGVLAGKTVVGIVLHSGHNLVRCSDGTLVAWGANSFGQLGDSTTVNRNAPVAVVTTGALSGKAVTAIATNTNHAMALCSDGTLAAWGNNNSGHLGSGGVTPSTVPVAVVPGQRGSRTIAAIAAGAYHSLALSTDGVIFSWGNNNFGQLGILGGNTGLYGAPMVAASNAGALIGKTVKSISAGFNCSYAICTDGTLASWGNNYAGVLGDTTTEHRYTPVLISTTGALADKAAVGITSASSTSMALVASTPSGTTPQTIAFSPLTNKMLGESPFLLNASATSGLAPNFTVVSGPASITGTTLSITGTGIVTVRATQNGNLTYAAAAPVERSFTVTNVTNDNFANALLINNPKTFGSNSFATGENGEPIHVNTSGSSSSVWFRWQATSTGTVKFDTLGSNFDTVLAVYSGAALGTLTKQGENDDDGTLSSSKITLSVTAGATYFIAVGSYSSMRGNIVLNSRYDSQSASLQTLTLNPIPAKVFGDAPFNLLATASSGLTPSFTVVSGPATLSGSTLTITGPGTLIVRVSQDGNATFAPAVSLDRSFKVTGNTVQTITFPVPVNTNVGDAPFALRATTTSGLTPSYTVVSGPATVSGSTVSTTGAGIVVIRASQTGSDIYLAAVPVERSFVISSGLSFTTPYTVQNHAGSGNYGSNDGAGLAADFKKPSAVALDSSGNLYIADTENHKIRKTTPDGVVTTLAGSGSPGSTDGIGAAAKFNNPCGVAVDATGNVYVADTDNHKIRKITPAGVVTTLAGSDTYGYSDAGVGTSAKFRQPMGITVDSSGNLYVADTFNHRIRKASPSGQVSTVAGSGNKIDRDGTGTGASFNYPIGIAVTSAGNLFVADSNNHKIRMITPANVVSTFAGTGSRGVNDGTGVGARFFAPTGLTIDNAGNLYVSEHNNHKIRKISTSGDVTTLAGDGASGKLDGTGSTSRFNAPSGLAVNSSGILYIADKGNNVIRSGSSLQSQIITSSIIPNKTLGDAPFSLVATSSSNLTPAFSIVSGPATVTGSILTINGTGVVVVRITQNGNENYVPAAAVERSFTVSNNAFTTYLINSNVPSNKRSANDDPDSDGIPNLIEYAQGLNPVVGNGGGFPMIELSGGSHLFRYKKAAQELIYTLETTVDLTNPSSWTNSGIAPSNPDVNGFVTHTIVHDVSRRFYRLKVSLP